jgi:hypothetical protein
MAFMNREGKLASPFDLAKYTPEYVQHQFNQLTKAVVAGVFPAHQTGGCFRCDVAQFCYVAGGAKSADYDPDDPGFHPPY